MDFKKLWGYIQARPWEKSPRTRYYPIYLMKGDTIIIDDDKCMIVTEDIKFKNYTQAITYWISKQEK